MDQRIAIYVYEKSTVTIAPSSTVDFMQMDDTDYSAKFLTTISSSITSAIDEGVYGFVYSGSHGVSGPSTITTVVDDYDIQRKNPWPQPPPPPPPPFVGKHDYDDHTKIFLVPLGTTFDLGADLSTSGSGDS
jgi:hypothetical protein